MYPGQLPSVKINLFNVILVLDLSQSSSISFIASAVSPIINRGFPFHFGVVPIIETEDGKFDDVASIVTSSYMCFRHPHGSTSLLAYGSREPGADLSILQQSK